MSYLQKLFLPSRHLVFISSRNVSALMKNVDDKYASEISDVRLAPNVFTTNVVPHHETYAEADERYAKFFAHPAVDEWLLRKGINDLMCYDQVPDVKVVDAALRACRRMNEHSLAVRLMEAIKLKCGNRVDEWWPYIRQEIQPTLDEFSISTPEEMGYDRPEFWFPDVDDM